MKIIIFAMYICLIFQAFAWGKHQDKENNKIITAIQDSGCSKPAQIELKPAVYNTWPNNKGIM